MQIRKKTEGKQLRHYKHTKKMVDLNSAISVVTLNTQRLHSNQKGRDCQIRLKKQTDLYCLQEGYLKHKDPVRLEVDG